jgi:hypothetical protein
MKFVLILIATAIGQDGTAITQVQFETVEACRAAEAAWRDEDPHGIRVAVLPCAAVGGIPAAPAVDPDL